MKIYGWRCQIIDNLHNATGSLPPVEGKREKESKGARAIKSFEVLQKAWRFISMHTYVPVLNNFSADDHICQIHDAQQRQNSVCVTEW